MSPLEIVQDCEYQNGEIGSPMATFWAKGHGFDQREFIRAALDYCLDNDVDIPAIAVDDSPVETWQQNIPRDGAVEYHRDDTPPTSPRSPRFPITLLDLEGARRHGGTKCSVTDCHEPWSVGTPVRVCVEPDSGDAELGSPYMAVCVWLCREHRKRLPGPVYRVALIPVGAQILLPATADAAVDSSGGESR